MANVLAPLRDATTFARAAVGDYGAAVTWDNGEGDLAIDAYHLKAMCGISL